VSQQAPKSSDASNAARVRRSSYRAAIRRSLR
jgi:hypothetical protein